MSRQKAQWLSCEARILTSSSRVGSSPLRDAASSRTIALYTSGARAAQSSRGAGSGAFFPAAVPLAVGVPVSCFAVVVMPRSLGAGQPRSMVHFHGETLGHL